MKAFTINRLRYLPQAFIERPLSQPGEILVKVGDEVDFFDVAAQGKFGKLAAGCAGRVVKTIPKRSVLIETSGVELEGVFSWGEEAVGEIAVVGDRHKPLSLRNIDRHLSGKIVVGGSYIPPEVLKKSLTIGVKALICGGICNDYGFGRGRGGISVLVLGGFGKIPLNVEIWDYFNQIQSQCAILFPERRVLFVTDKSCPSGVQVGRGESYYLDIKVGQKVQVFSWPFFGYSGEVCEVLEMLVTVPSGLKLECVRVKLEGGDEEVTIPVRNIGVLV